MSGKKSGDGGSDSNGKYGWEWEEGEGWNSYVRDIHRLNAAVENRDRIETWILLRNGKRELRIIVRKDCYRIDDRHFTHLPSKRA